MAEVLIFSSSLERCLRKPQFTHEFYVRFLFSSDDVRRKFDLTNFDEQEKRLARSLRTLGAAMEGDPTALRHLNARAESHDRNHANIEPHLYILWRESLMRTAAEFDEEWTEDVADAWGAVLDHAIHFMIKRYEV